MEAGYSISRRKMAVWVRHPDKEGRLLPLTPDIVFPEHRLAIEIDPCAPANGFRGYSHFGKEEEDLLRNTLLEEAGWTVVRLRLGASEGGQIGERDVVCESNGITKAVAVEFVAAVAEFLSGQPAVVRFVPKNRAPKKPAQRKSSVQRLGEYKYSDDGHIFTWFPDPASDEKRYLRLACAGRFLYSHDKPPRYIADIGLGKLPVEQWAGWLEKHVVPLMQSAPERGSLFPWGDSLLIQVEQNNPSIEELIFACGSRSTIDHEEFYFTSNCDSLAMFTDYELLDTEGQVLVELHPEARSFGYRIKDAEICGSTAYGRFERITISRAS